MRIVGSKFGKLRVLKETRFWVYLCRCDCGQEVEVFHSCLIKRVRVDCLSKECHPYSHKKTNGHCRILRSGREVQSREKYTFSNMRARCRNKNSDNWESYGGRGIAVCSRWLETDGQGFRNFLEDMGPRPPGMTLDRKDVNGNYEPGNCKWSTPKEQYLNQRTRCMVRIPDAALNPQPSSEDIAETEFA